MNSKEETKIVVYEVLIDLLTVEISNLDLQIRDRQNSIYRGLVKGQYEEVKIKVGRMIFKYLEGMKKRVIDRNNQENVEKK